ncbi:hypothetical protein QAD02_011795 [Eretmocerus hayati]|uniref:Uncharacterized protein n=1 Tax=Eretmocerus hayati TaxID=131215 RepID=A0ACC2P0F9_9HYME|nr:hypothetical protein QAD02_011795 [Eretmocerus hayati]
MGQGAEASETCADRPTEVSVIRFVSRNRTIEEIAPKKEVYICKQQGCGKVFTNQDDFKTHEVLETLKIRFICKEPGCGEEVPDPGSMWRHYQEWHNHETDVFICPYTNCGSPHATSELLEEHIESSHRHLPTIPTEPEIICFEGPDNVIQENISTVNEDTDRYSNIQNEIDEVSNDEGLLDDQYSRNESFCTKQVNNDFCLNEESKVVSTSSQQANNFNMGQSKLRAALCQESYHKNTEPVKFCTKFPKNKDLLITKENFYDTYDSQTPINISSYMQIDRPCDKNTTVFISDDVSLTKTSTQEHRIELGDLEKVFRHGLEQDSVQAQESTLRVKNSCLDDEEYTPKKQRMSRNKQDTSYKCQVLGCGKVYKSISHFKHHQDSHKIISQVTNTNVGSIKPLKSKMPIKTHTISFFICKFTGCGAEASNGNALWKHYQETHVKPLASKSNEVYRCMNAGCGSEFSSSSALQKHISDTHSKNSIDFKIVKTGNGTSVLIENSPSKNTVISQREIKTESESKSSSNLNDYQHSKINLDRSTIGEQPGD